MIATNDVGIGTIVGSAVFNVLFVIAFCAFFSKKALELTAYPLVRDTAFYVLALGLLVAFFLDEKIKWWEALILFILYFVYVAYMTFNSFFETRFLYLFPGTKKADNPVSVPGGIRGMGKKLLAQMQENINDFETDSGAKPGGGMKNLKNILSGANDPVEEQVTELGPEKGMDEEEAWKNPVISGLQEDALWKKLLCIISLPLTVPMFLTIPDPGLKNFRKLFLLTLLMSIIWIAGFAYLMVWWATVVCTVIGFSEVTLTCNHLTAVLCCVGHDGHNAAGGGHQRAGPHHLGAGGAGRARGHGRLLFHRQQPLRHSTDIASASELTFYMVDICNGPGRRDGGSPRALAAPRRHPRLGRAGVQRGHRLQHRDALPHAWQH